MKPQTNGIEARKLEVGEKIAFSDFIINQAFTSYGETSVISFADNNDKVIRKIFSNSLAKYLRENKPKKFVALKKKIVDGTMTFNVYESE